MQLTSEFLMSAANVAASKTEKRPDSLWLVTTFRTDVYILLKKIGTTIPNGIYKGANTITNEILDVVRDFAEILANFPVEIKYNDDKVETPRLNAVERCLEVANGLESDAKHWESAQELTRIIATNPDSEQQKITYDLLMGIVLRILDLLGDVDIMGVCAALLN